MADTEPPVATPFATIAPPTTVAPSTTTDPTASSLAGAPGSTADAAQPTALTLVPPGQCVPGTYTIDASDTSRLRVAQKFDVTVDALDAANAATPGYGAFFPGLEIIIPC